MLVPDMRRAEGPFGDMPGMVAPSKPAPTPGPDKQDRIAPPDQSSTGATPPTQEAVLSPPPPRFDPADAPIETLAGGINALSYNDMAQARAIRDSLPQASLDRHLLAWAIALKGGPDVPSADIVDELRNLKDWPGRPIIQRNLERALFREQPPVGTVIAELGDAAPVTAKGAILLARAKIAAGNPQAGIAILSPFWRTERMDADDETAIITEFGSLIPAADHRVRMEEMLYAERVKSAERVADLAGARPLFAAWSAVLGNNAKAGKLLDAVPKDQRDAGYLFAKARLQRRHGDLTGAAATMKAAPKDADSLIDGDAWWTERRLLSRQLIDAGKPQLAYDVAAGHGAESPASGADAEFHAGWYALRWLKDPEMAAGHFARIAEISNGPISLARSFYWQGRAADAGGPGDAAALYGRAAAFGTTFYGQLAAARLNRSNLSMAEPQPSDADRKTFEGREAVRAVARLEQANAPALAATLYVDIAEQLTSPGELALLAGMAEARGNHYLALKVGKAAAQRGMDIGALSHPLGAIPDAADISGSGKALAYAIARQESEFNVGAVSPAGALGLLQLMPSTAEQVARRTGLAFAPERLTTDAGYNATLGAAFLGQQLDRFNGSYVLTFAGYNAGPRRAEQWIARYGDPRGKSIETVVDWIERIPFSETRSYVQRVMENYEVYKMRLSGKYDIVGDLTQGR